MIEIAFGAALGVAIFLGFLRLIKIPVSVMDFYYYPSWTDGSSTNNVSFIETGTLPVDYSFYQKTIQEMN